MLTTDCPDTCLLTTATPAEMAAFAIQQKAAFARVIESARRLVACADEFDGEPEVCGEYMDELCDAVEGLDV